jgi:hypothetical protein
MERRASYIAKVTADGMRSQYSNPKILATSGRKPKPISKRVCVDGCSPTYTEPNSAMLA